MPYAACRKDLKLEMYGRPPFAQPKGDQTMETWFSVGSVGSLHSSSSESWPCWPPNSEGLTRSRFSKGWRRGRGTTNIDAPDRWLLGCNGCLRAAAVCRGNCCVQGKPSPAATQQAAGSERTSPSSRRSRKERESKKPATNSVFYADERFVDVPPEGSISQWGIDATVPAAFPLAFDGIFGRGIARLSDTVASW